LSPGERSEKTASKEKKKKRRSKSTPSRASSEKKRPRQEKALNVGGRWALKKKKVATPKNAQRGWGGHVRPKEKPVLLAEKKHLLANTSLPKEARPKMNASSLKGKKPDLKEDSDHNDPPRKKRKVGLGKFLLFLHTSQKWKR